MLLADIYNGYEAAGELLDKEAPAALSFKIADLIVSLEGKRKAAQITINKLPKDENGKPDYEELCKLMSTETDISVPRLTRKEIEEGFQIISPKVVIALMPFLEVESDG